MIEGSIVRILGGFGPIGQPALVIGFGSDTAFVEDSEGKGWEIPLEFLEVLATE